MKLPFKLFGVVLIVLLLPLAANASDCNLYGQKWKLYSNSKLGVTFCYPSKLVLQTEGQDIYVLRHRSAPHKKTILSHKNNDLLFNGKRMLEPNDYIGHIKIGAGDFLAANNKEKIFIYEKGVVRAGIGRFDNAPAKIVRTGNWAGYKSEIICSTSDPKTGFHAAGGQCLWIVGSDSQHYFVLDTLGDPSDATLAWKITKSLRLLPEPTLTNKPHGRMSPRLGVMFMC